MVDLHMKCLDGTLKFLLFVKVAVCYSRIFRVLGLPLRARGFVVFPLSIFHVILTVMSTLGSLQDLDIVRDVCCICV